MSTRLHPLPFTTSASLPTLVRLPFSNDPHTLIAATLGHSEAIAEIERSDKMTSAGVATFLLWRSVYMSKLLSVRNRVFVALDWFKSQVFGRDISRG